MLLYLGIHIYFLLEKNSKEKESSGRGLDPLPESRIASFPESSRLWIFDYTRGDFRRTVVKKCGLDMANKCLSRQLKVLWSVWGLVEYGAG